jgi:pimeloyl-ACP methyl ester carboxylesterase
MATFVVVHGAWSAGWAWKKMRPLMRARGHEIFTPTCTGLGERTHLGSPSVGLHTHVDDMTGVLEFEDLSGIVLVAHSYGGMVATMLADRMPGRIAHLLYLDAFVPRDGQSVVDLVGAEVAAAMRAGAAATGEGWKVPANPLPTDTPPDDIAWIMPRRKMQPVRCFEEPARLTGAIERVSRSYIYCLKAGPGDVFRQFARRAQSEGWPYRELDCGHNPHLNMPEALAGLFEATLPVGDRQGGPPA